MNTITKKAIRFIAIAVVIANVVCCGAFTQPVLAASADSAYEVLVDTIYNNLQKQNKEFSVIYFGDNLEADVLQTAVNKAMTLSFKNLISITRLSARYMGKNAYITADYDAPNDYSINYAASWSDVKNIINRAVANNEEGINIYIEDTSHINDPNSIYDLAYKTYEECIDNPIDDYNAYSFSVMRYRTIAVSNRPGGYFITYSFSYNETEDQRLAVNEFVSSVSDKLGLEHMSQREKVEAINKFVCDYTSYDNTEQTEDITAYGLIKNHSAVCQGYSLLTSALLTKAGVDNRLVVGTGVDVNTGTQGPHMWNAVKVDGKWRYLDVTWNDASNGENSYFLISSEQIKKDHVFDSAKYNDSAFDQAIEAYKAKRDTIVNMTIGQPIMTVGNNYCFIDTDHKVVPEIISSRTMLPLRSLIENIGGSVTWDGNNQKVTINYRDYVIELFINKNRVFVNGIEQAIDAPAIIKNDRTLLPTRFICETMGMSVDWNPDTKEVTIIPS